MNDYVIAYSSIIVALITGICSIITTIIWGYIPRKRKEEIKKLRKELLDVYMSAYNLKQVEENFEAEAGISKTEARKGYTLSSRLERPHSEKNSNITRSTQLIFRGRSHGLPLFHKNQNKISNITYNHMSIKPNVDKINRNYFIPDIQRN